MKCNNHTCKICRQPSSIVGKIIRRKCWYCRYPFLKSKDLCTKSKRLHLQQSGKEPQLEYFNKFVSDINGKLTTNKL